MKKKQTFEDAMARLQEIIEKLESGEEPLDNSLKLYEEGAKLSAFCYKTLDAAEQKVTELSKYEIKAEETDAE